MHYKTAKLDFDIAGLDAFLSGKTNVEKAKSLHITKETLPQPAKIIALEYQR